MRLARHHRMFQSRQHLHVLGRHVHVHDVFELLDELGISRDLEAPRAIRLQSGRALVARNTGGADARLSGHHARTPMGGCAGLLCVVSSPGRATSTFDGGAPRDRSRWIPASRCWAWRSRQRATWTRPRHNRAAIALVCLLSAASKTIRTRNTSLTPVSLERTSRLSSMRSSQLSTMAGATPRTPSLRRHRRKATDRRAAYRLIQDYNATLRRPAAGSALRPGSIQ